MNELIVKSGDTDIIDPQAVQAIVEYTLAVKVAEAKLDDIKERLREEMERKNVIKLESEADDMKVTVNFIAPTDSESFNSKKFRKDHPDLYDEYVEIKQKSGYLKMKVA